MWCCFHASSLSSFASSSSCFLLTPRASPSGMKDNAYLLYAAHIYRHMHPLFLAHIEMQVSFCLTVTTYQRLPHRLQEPLHLLPPLLVQNLHHPHHPKWITRKFIFTSSHILALHCNNKSNREKSRIPSEANA